MKSKTFLIIISFIFLVPLNSFAQCTPPKFGKPVHSSSVIYFGISDSRISVANPNLLSNGKPFVDVYEYIHTKNSWKKKYKLILNTGDTFRGDKFGVSESGNTIAVPYTNSTNDIRMYVFTYDSEANSWLRSDVDVSLGNGLYSIDASDSVIVIGNKNENSNTGAVQIFELIESAWTPSTVLNGENTGDELGAAVTVLDDAVIAGAPKFDDSISNQGKAYVYKSDLMLGWVEDSTISGDNAKALFGKGIDADEENDLLGISGSGQTRIYSYSGGSFVQLGNDFGEGDFFVGFYENQFCIYGSLECYSYDSGTMDWSSTLNFSPETTFLSPSLTNGGFMTSSNNFVVYDNLAASIVNFTQTLPEALYAFLDYAQVAEDAINADDILGGITALENAVYEIERAKYYISSRKKLVKSHITKALKKAQEYEESAEEIDKDEALLFIGLAQDVLSSLDIDVTCDSYSGLYGLLYNLIESNPIDPNDFDLTIDSIVEDINLSKKRKSKLVKLVGQARDASVAEDSETATEKMISAIKLLL